jgi:hypothetical protein
MTAFCPGQWRIVQFIEKGPRFIEKGPLPAHARLPGIFPPGLPV